MVFRGGHGREVGIAKPEIGKKVGRQRARRDLNEMNQRLRRGIGKW